MIRNCWRHRKDSLDLLGREVISATGKIWAFPLSVDMTIFLLAKSAEARLIGVSLGKVISRKESAV